MGDEVLSRDENDPEGPLVWKRIEAVFVTWALVTNLHVGGSIIETTAEHPFGVAGRGWTAAGELAIGDGILGMAVGATTAVEGVAPSGLYQQVYNLRVADFHTYFVGDDGWDFSVWAHNDYSSKELAKKGKQLRDGNKNEILVKNKNEAKEVFFREFRSGKNPKYRDTTGWKSEEYRRHGKAGTYHWDDVPGKSSERIPGATRMEGHYDDGNAHSYWPHLQIHTHDGRVVRILYGPRPAGLPSTVAPPS